MDVETIVQALEAHKRGEKRDQTMVRFLAYRGYVTVTPVTHPRSSLKGTFFMTYSLRVLKTPPRVGKTQVIS